jgi:hypothetical protein
MFGYASNYPVSGDDTALGIVQGKTLANRTRDAIASSDALMNEARGWFADCTAYDCDVSEYSNTEVLNYVARNYSYGLMGFYLASRTLTPVITRSAV